MDGCTVRLYGCDKRIAPVVVGLVFLLAGRGAAHEIALPPELARAGESLQIVVSGLSGFAEGPAVSGGGELYFSEINMGNPSQGKIWKVDTEGVSSVFRTGSSNGLVFDAQDRLIACEQERISRVEANGDVTVLAQGAQLGWANDITLTSDGGCFFTSPVWDGQGSIFYLSPDGELKTVMSDVAGFPNGIAYLEESNRLFVAFSQRNRIEWYPVLEGMMPGTPAIFAQCATPDGFAFDEEGNLWVVAHAESKVIVFNSSGVEIGHITIAGEASAQNCAFGGPDRSVLYIAARDGVYKLRTGAVGRLTNGTAPLRSGRFFPENKIRVTYPSTKGNRPAALFMLDGRFTDVFGGSRAGTGIFLTMGNGSKKTVAVHVLLK